MMQLLFLIHAVIGVFMLFTRPLAETDRVRFIRLGAGAGMLASVVLFLVRGADTSWGAATLRPGSGALVAGAMFCAWTLVAAVGSARWDIGALVGAGATGLCLLATSDWTVPALLFWIVVSLATAAAVPATRRSAATWLVVALSDACFAGGLIAFSLDEGSWRLPEGVDGWMVAPLVAAIVLRTGVLAGGGIWELSAGPQVALLPLVVGSGLALVPAASAGDDIYVAVGLLLVAVAMAAQAILSATPRVAVAGAWITTAMLAVTWIHPSALARAGVAAVLGITATALWPWTAGRGQAERGLLLAAVPLTVGFGVIVGGAAASFERATVAQSVLESAPWSAFAALLPVALAAGVTLGAAVARRSEPERYEPPAVLATWGVAGIGLVLGLSPRADLAFTGGGPAGTRGTWLFVVAALAGVAAARVVGRASPAVMEQAGTASGQAPSLSGSLARAVALSAGVAAAAAAVAVAWFTYEGLRNGFL